MPGGAAVAERRIAWRLFAAAWIAYGCFHQGGGWSQNARFAMVRAIVEQGRLSVDDYLLYRPVPGAGARLERIPVENGAFRAGDHVFALAWSGSGEPLRGDAGGALLAPIAEVAATGDLAWSRGHLHPNKAPGTTLLAVPAYFALYRAERLLGIDPDDRRVLGVNAWLTGAASVGLVAAASCALFFSLALRLSRRRPGPALAATVVFAFGTPFFPYATLLFDNDVVAAGLLAAVHFGWRAGDLPARRPRADPLLAGTAAGAAVLASYVALLALPLLALDLGRRSGRHALTWFALGVGGALSVLAAYHQLCFGAPWLTPYQLEDPLFREAGAVLEVFGPPRLEVLFAVLLSPYRGLFFASPVLLLGLAGLAWMARDPAQRSTALLFSGIAAVFLLFNICFNGWHGGWGVGPRYLVPAVPFLALPLVFAWQRARVATLLLGSVSIGAMTLFTVVDPQTPVGTSPIAARPDRARLLREPLSEYALPIFLSGRAGPILDAQAVAHPDAALPLEHFVGPVSANPMGLYEGWFGRLYPATGEAARWNSFNVGEFLWPQRRLSLLLPLALVAPFLGSALAIARRASRES